MDFAPCSASDSIFSGAATTLCPLVKQRAAIVVAAITPPIRRIVICSPPSRRWMSRTPPRGEIQAVSFSLHSCASLSGFVKRAQSFNLNLAVAASK